jgi:hypothetical protein
MKIHPDLVGFKGIAIAVSVGVVLWALVGVVIYLFWLK